MLLYQLVDSINKCECLIQLLADGYILVFKCNFKRTSKMFLIKYVNNASFLINYTTLLIFNVFNFVQFL